MEQQKVGVMNLESNENFFDVAEKINQSNVVVVVFVSCVIKIIPFSSANQHKITRQMAHKNQDQITQCLLTLNQQVVYGLLRSFVVLNEKRIFTTLESTFVCVFREC
jgi:hypothetical protein